MTWSRYTARAAGRLVFCAALLTLADLSYCQRQFSLQLDNSDNQDAVAGVNKDVSFTVSGEVIESPPAPREPSVELPPVCLETSAWTPEFGIKELGPWFSGTGNQPLAEGMQTKREVKFYVEPGMMVLPHIGVQLDVHHSDDGFAKVQGPGFDARTTLRVSKEEGKQQWRSACGKWAEVKSGFYTYKLNVHDTFVRMRFFTRPKKGYVPSQKAYDVDEVIVNVDSNIKVQGSSSNAFGNQQDREHGKLVIDIAALVKGQDDAVLATLGSGGQ